LSRSAVEYQFSDVHDKLRAAKKLDSHSVLRTRLVGFLCIPQGPLLTAACDRLRSYSKNSTRIYQWPKRQVPSESSNGCRVIRNRVSCL
jgi:hypothetical protein